MMKRILNSVALLLTATVLGGCFERPPVDVVQSGYRGTGMQQVSNPRIVEAQAPIHQAPPDPGPPLPDAGPKARDIYKNVQVLGDLSVANFSRHMAQITSWVSPKEGCNYCHNGANFADDSLYTKVVARRMIQMNQHLNANWKQHVGNTGVTCYTCHRGNPVPSNVWFAPLKDARANFIGATNQQNEPLDVVALSSLPNDPFTPYLKEAKPIRVNSPTALPTGNRSSIQQAEHTFGLMVHFSKSLGVNCTYCHNTRETGDWSHGAMATNATAYHGIRMVRSANNDYIEGLTSVFPAQRLGPTGDVAKVNCATCHQGAFKPLYGAEMAKNFPELQQVVRIGTLPPPVDEEQRSVLYFGVGKTALEGSQTSGMARLVAYLTVNPAKKALISGYHSASGELAVNQELAKQRAFAVRDTLQAAGVGATRVVLDKPLQTEASISGEDPVARRVEVTIR